MGEQVPGAMSLGGVVLAGGESRRMGRDKATLPLPGVTTTLVEHVVGVVGQRCEPVIVMAAPGQPLPPLQATVLRDEVRGLGPLPATGRGLRAAAAAGARFAFVCAVDMPLLTVELIDDLVRRAVQTNAEVVLPWDGRSHYLAAVYRTELADRVDALVAAGERKMSAFVDACDAQRIVMPDSGSLSNVNTAAELRIPAQQRR
ncbi:molybdenum cofactor guanylyltransferase [Mycobacterium kansasii]|uniref:Probable molybdenum cofactor guanylyltransferase n=1 Tax=Mycobacterium attenuatum TaxID=2341086 RepID=A0A498Q7L5_9MYCO|nr:molybdenum cofactor guanylyltransferase [Mycobacterium attenuatum]ORB83233.1 molybdenum cofactor guanylyltransferase [Mycobacterium kansasii]VBA40854.1 putative molybdenum cofactor guanylyltransferase [Mycobacterium attenuatum]VBA56676.1 putative molybdenum cofactor guanylyltransferase [Mycobacterium attenuatum]VBA60122.1 putative molybdenum cofactor guanylyltransferase [Mycobacterium attenuatum]